MIRFSVSHAKQPRAMRLTGATALLASLTACSLPAPKAATIPHAVQGAPRRKESIAFAFRFNPVTGDQPSRTVASSGEKLDGKPALMESYSAVIVRNFSSAVSLGVVPSVERALQLARSRPGTPPIDAVLVLSDFQSIFYNRQIGGSAFYPELDQGSEYHFRYQLFSLDGVALETESVSGTYHESGYLPVDFKRPGRLVNNAMLEAGKHLERLVQQSYLSAEQRRLDAQAAREMEAFRERFAAIGFDPFSFTAAAKAALASKYEIDFGAAQPNFAVRDFRGKSYLSLRLRYLVTYNTVKLNLYQSSAITFDEVVKKLLRLLLPAVKEPASLDGYIFDVTYTTRDFLEKTDVPRVVHNEFIMPRDACEAYLNLDITNQALVDRSVVLVDGDRVALSLQR